MKICGGRIGNHPSPGAVKIQRMSRRPNQAWFTPENKLSLTSGLYFSLYDHRERTDLCSGKTVHTADYLYPFKRNKIFYNSLPKI